MTLIQFGKTHTRRAQKLLIEVIATLAGIEGDDRALDLLIDDLSIVLAVMNKCHDAAPDIPSLGSEAASKKNEREKDDL